MGVRVTLTAAQWQDARVAWESDPTATHGDIAKRFGVDRSALTRRANANGWAKAGTVAPLPPAKKTDPASEAEFVANREKVKHNHRAEWVHHRNQFGLKELASGDFDACKKAKIIAEMLTIRQMGERKAWAMDDQAKDEKPVVVEWAD